MDISQEQARTIAESAALMLGAVKEKQQNEDPTDAYEVLRDALRQNSSFNMYSDKEVEQLADEFMSALGQCDGIYEYLCNNFPDGGISEKELKSTGMLILNGLMKNIPEKDRRDELIALNRDICAALGESFSEKKLPKYEGALIEYTAEKLLKFIRDMNGDVEEEILKMRERALEIDPNDSWETHGTAQKKIVRLLMAVAVYAAVRDGQFGEEYGLDPGDFTPQAAMLIVYENSVLKEQYAELRKEIDEAFEDFNKHLRFMDILVYVVALIGIVVAKSTGTAVAAAAALVWQTLRMMLRPFADKAEDEAKNMVKENPKGAPDFDMVTVDYETGAYAYSRENVETWLRPIDIGTSASNENDGVYYGDETFVKDEEKVQSREKG